MIYALDIETECAVEGCVDTQCDHALIPHQSRITCVGIWSPTIQKVFRDLGDLQTWFWNRHEKDTLIGHNLKFDLKHLYYRGAEIFSKADWHDTNLMAAVAREKIPEEWLTSYERQRLIENKKLPKGYSHRKAKGYSLKTLAPYFLGVAPFWEDPSNHDNDSYVLKDCEYTYRLYEYFSNRLREEDSYSFYENKFLPWAKMLLNAELRGIRVDLDLIKKKQKEAEEKAKTLEEELDQEWSEAYKAYHYIQVCGLDKKYKEMEEKSIARLKKPTPDKLAAINKRCNEKFDNAVAALPRKLNLNSPDQVLWLLRDYFKLDTEVRARDKKKGQVGIKDSTGVEVLQRLAREGREDIRKFLDYREQIKLSTSFFPTYLELQSNGYLHPNFNPTGTRTGRISASLPNLQQVPSNLHDIFIARPGYKLGCFDMAAIEARMIAYYSEDPILYDLIKNEIDIHGYHTIIFFDLECDPSEVKAKYKFERGVTKNIGFGLYYSAGANRVQQEAMRNGLDWNSQDCQQKVRKFKETYETVIEFKEALDKEASRGNQIKNLLGRPFSFPDPEDIYMKCFNTLIQSSASDLVLHSAFKIQKEFREKDIDGHILLLVHDEIVAEVREDQIAEAQEIIERNMTDYVLMTSLGKIDLKVEGGFAECWKK